MSPETEAGRDRQIAHAEGQVRVTEAEYDRLVRERECLENMISKAYGDIVKAKTRLAELIRRRDG